MKRIDLLGLLLLLASVWCGPALAVTCTSIAAGGNWNNIATWTGCAGGNGPVANTPGSNDTAVIATTGAASVVTANVAITVGNVVINSGKLNVGGANWTVNGTTTVNNNGAIDQTSTGGSATFIGLVTVNAGGAWADTAGEAIVFRGGITNDGTFNSGTGTYTFNTNSQAIAGASPINFGGIVAVASGVTITNNNTSEVTIAGNLTGGSAASTWVNAANSTLNYGGAAAPMGTRVFTASAAGNTVNYNRAGVQTVKLPSVSTYHHLTLSGSGAKTMPAAALAIDGNFTLSGTASATAAGALNVGGNFTVDVGATFAASTFSHSVAGNFSNSGTFTANTSTFTFNGAAAQSFTGVTTFYNLTMSNAAGFTMNDDVTAANVLTLTSGIVSTGANTLITTANCPASVSRTSGHIAGNLRLTIPATDPVTCTFHVGDANNYAPITVTKTGANTGTLTGSGTAGDHADTTAGTSGIDKNKSVNRYWTLTGGTLASGTPYSATFQFCNAIGTGCGVNDVDAGAAFANFIVAKKTGGAWTAPTVGTKTSTSTQATGLNTFGEFAVGETGPNHYAFSYPLGQPGITCEAQAIRITAHADATNHALLIAPSNTTQITVSTTPAANSWALKSGGGAFLTGPGAGQARYTFDGAEQFVDLWLTQTTATTSPHINIDVSDGTATDVDPGAEDARAEFADTVFRFFADAVAEGIGTQIAGKSSSVAPGNQTLQLRAVQTSTTTGACQAAMTGVDTPVELAFSCNNPATCKSANGVTVVASSTATIQDNPNGGPLSYSSVTMNFGGTGVAPFSISYADAGQITLHARKVLAADNTTTPPTTAFTLLGNSNALVVKPAGVCVQSTDPNADCVSGDATCSVFKKAGTSADADPGSKFNLIVRGVSWESAVDADFCSGVAGTNLTTPNFQLNAIPLTHTKIRPTGPGSQTGSLGVGSVNIAAADDGAATITNQAFSEVGVITITATPPLYQGQTIAAAVSANIGRFVPDRFTVTDNSPGFANACTSGTPFTYRGQEFYYGTAPVLTVTALNTAGAVTQNYGDSTGGPERFWKLTSTLNRSYSDQSGHVPAFSSADLAGVTLSGDTDFADGAGTLTLANTLGNRDIFMYDRPDLTSPEAPFAASVNLSFLVAGLTDSDGVCYDRDDDGTCEAYTHLIQGGAEAGSGPVTGASQRFGRLVIGTAAGSELLPIALPVRTEYYDGAAFVVNTVDVCTAIAATDLVLTSGVEGPETDGNIDVSNDAGCAVGTTTVTIANTPFVNGEAGVSFSAPGESCTGHAEVDIDLSALSLTIGAETYPDMGFLRYDWLDADGNDDGPYTADPAGRVDFGIYEGPDSLIYTREPW